MPREEIPVADLVVSPHHLFSQQWLLLTAGDFAAGTFNTMTVAWGSLGTMWNKPFAQVVVRPSRYTLEFIEQYPTFTLCAFPPQQKKALQLLGTQSGRDGDKIGASGLTPTASLTVAAPGFEEADLTIECRKMYSDTIKAAGFIDPDIDKQYPDKDYHHVYFGEIVTVAVNVPADT